MNDINNALANNNIINRIQFMPARTEEKTPNVEIHCPKCGSTTVEKRNNQEHRCTKCGEIFYFVTPKCGSQLDLERYKL
jgi:tRNA(Ile2) C34 agmatinyltransferase TiaS